MSPPRATYRLEMQPGLLDFDQARALLPYLHDLGISHVHLSPGGSEREPGLQALTDAARALDMGLLLDTDPAGDEENTGAGFSVEVQAVFVDPAGEEPLTDLWAELSGDARPYEDWAADANDEHGVENAALHRYLRLLALNEAGGDPGRFGLSVADFHAANAERARRFPQALLRTSTPGNERSADVRARLGVLAGLGEEWAGAVRRWRADNAVLRRPGASAPTPAEELLVYQTLIGAWPIERDRLEAYLVEALREAEQGSSWAEPDEGHERDVLAFAAALLEHGPFRYGFDGWAARVADAGARAAYGQLLLKLTCPGVPVVSQGDEMTFLALVDPDNRRPVDRDARRDALAALRGGDMPSRELAKLHLVWSALTLRAEVPEAFDGSYTPIPAGDGVCAFLRGTDVLVAVAVRESVTGAEGWALPAQAEGSWRDVIAGAEHELPDGASLAAVLGPDGRALLRRT